MRKCNARCIVVRLAGRDVAWKIHVRPAVCGMLRLLGCDELIASSVETLADLAVALAHDKPRCERLSARIRDRFPSMVHSDDALIALDDALRKMLAG